MHISYVTLILSAPLCGEFIKKVEVICQLFDVYVMKLDAEDQLRDIRGQTSQLNTMGRLCIVAGSKWLGVRAFHFITLPFRINVYT